MVSRESAGATIGWREDELHCAALALRESLQCSEDCAGRVDAMLRLEWQPTRDERSQHTRHRLRSSIRVCDVACRFDADSFNCNVERRAHLRCDSVGAAELDLELLSLRPERERHPSRNPDQMRTQQRRQRPEESDEAGAFEAFRQHESEVRRGRRRAAAQGDPDDPSGDNQPERDRREDHRELEVMNE